MIIKKCNKVITVTDEQIQKTEEYSRNHTQQYQKRYYLGTLGEWALYNHLNSSGHINITEPKMEYKHDGYVDLQSSKLNQDFIYSVKTYDTFNSSGLIRKSWVFSDNDPILSSTNNKEWVVLLEQIEVDKLKICYLISATELKNLRFDYKQNGGAGKVLYDDYLSQFSLFYK